jgi:hypothetical protein
MVDQPTRCTRSRAAEIRRILTRVQGKQKELGAVVDPVNADAEVEVGAAGVAGVAGEHDLLAGDDLVAEGDGEA